MALPHVTIIGTVKFKETKTLPSGKQLTSMTVSCSNKRKDGNYDNLNIKAEFWEQQSTFADQYFQDGSPIIVSGELITNTFEVNGVKRQEIKFNFPRASFVPKDTSNAQPSQAPQQQSQYQQQAQPIPEINIESDSVPF